MPIRRDIKKLIATEKKLISLIKKDSEIVEKKLSERDISVLFRLVGQQESINEQEIMNLESELKEEEKIIEHEIMRAGREKRAELKRIDDKELVDEIHHLRITYVLIPLVRQKNESLRKQKELLEEKRAELTLADLPMLIRKERDILDKMKMYEEEAEEVLKSIEREEAQKESLSTEVQRGLKW